VICEKRLQLRKKVDFGVEKTGILFCASKYTLPKKLKYAIK
jgi:hypothetical protein